MAASDNIKGIGTIWNLPNYAGELFTADAEQTPLLSMTGGLTGGLTTTNFEFPTAQLFNYEDASQPAISETVSATAIEPKAIIRTQANNTVQIHREAIELTYWKMSNSGRLGSATSNLNTAGAFANPEDEMSWQTARALTKIARDVEYSFIQGTYAAATSAAVAAKTRGLLELIEKGGGSLVSNTEQLSRDTLNSLYRMMAGNGAYFTNMVMFVNAYQKQMVSTIYSSQNGFALPATRNVGGVNIQTIETDFFNMGVVWSRFVPEDTVLLVDVAHVAPVFMEVPGKGLLFVEDIATVAASEKKMLYGQIGLAHGPGFLHGAIKGLKTAPATTPAA